MNLFFKLLTMVISQLINTKTGKILWEPEIVNKHDEIDIFKPRWGYEEKHYFNYTITKNYRITYTFLKVHNDFIELAANYEPYPANGGRKTCRIKYSLIPQDSRLGLDGFVQFVRKITQISDHISLQIKNITDIDISKSIVYDNKLRIKFTKIGKYFEYVESSILASLDLTKTNPIYYKTSFYIDWRPINILLNGTLSKEFPETWENGRTKKRLFGTLFKTKLKDIKIVFD